MTSLTSPEKEKNDGPGIPIRISQMAMKAHIGQSSINLNVTDSNESQEGEAIVEPLIRETLVIRKELDEMNLLK